MQKQISSKKIIIILCAAAVIIAAAVVLLLPKDEFFRSVLVYDLEGSAVIERADIGTIDAAENLYLESGDRVNVKDESMMRMKLDDDKYITAEENTVFSLEAEGDEQDSRTRIRLEQGAITNEIQNPLSKGSLYETATPNSVMAVRGTVYRVHLYDDGAGGQNTRLCCFQGTVAAAPILPDGTLGEEVLVHEGCELTVYSDGSMNVPGDIDFDTLPKQAIQTLSDLSASGTAVSGITKDALSSMLSSYEPGAAEADLSEDESSETAESAQRVSVKDTTAADSAKKSAAETGAQGGRRQTPGGQAASAKPTVQSTGDAAKDRTEVKPQDTPPASENTTVISGSSDSDSSGSNSDDSVQGSDASQGRRPNSSSNHKPDKPSPKAAYTVTYIYQGSVFASQIVEQGGKAVTPVLVPAETGAWNFDFDTEITADTTIEWDSTGE